MATALRPPTKEIAIRDTGVSRFAELRLIARFNAVAAEIIYRATGTVSKDVVPRLRQWVYGVQSGRIKIGRDFQPMLEVLAGGASRKIVSQHEARAALIELLAIGREIIDLQLPPETPVDPNSPTKGHATYRSGTQPRVGRFPLGSDDHHTPTGCAA